MRANTGRIPPMTFCFSEYKSSMKKYNKHIILMLIFVLSGALIAGIIWFAVSPLIPPDREKTEKQFKRDRESLCIIADYLSDLDYSFVVIDKSGLKNETMFTGAYTRYQKINDKRVMKSLNKVLCYGKYLTVGKSDNTVFFKKWKFLEKDRGIAFSINKDEPPAVEFLVKYEKLSESGWYYYESDYEEWRTKALLN